MLIANLVTHETKEDEESPATVLALYNFENEDEDDPAVHPAQTNLSPVSAPDPPPKSKRRRQAGSKGFWRKSKGKCTSTSDVTTVDSVVTR